MSENTSNTCSQPGSVRAVLVDAPVDEGHILPPGWQISAPGLYPQLIRVRGDSAIPVCEAFVICAELNTPAGTLLEISFNRGRGWQTAVISWEALSSSRAFVDALARHGINITAVTGRAALEYVSAYRACNAGRIPLIRGVTRAGWVPGLRAFAIGHTVVGPDAAAVRAVPGSVGEDELLRPVAVAGDAEPYTDLLRRIPDDAAVWRAIYAAASAPLLGLVDADPVIMVHLCGESSSGKTRAVTLCAAMYGRPGGGAEQGLVRSWAQTETSAERTLGLFCDLPTVLDELGVQDAQALDRLVYRLSSGQEKARGSIEGLRQQKRWRGVVLSTGEIGLAAYSRRSGVQARVIELAERPFGPGDQGDLVERIRSVCQRHHGHAGLRLVEHLAGLDNAAVQQIRDRYQQLLNGSFRRPGGGIANRLAGQFALIATAGEILHGVLNLPGDAVARVLATWEDQARRCTDEIPLHCRAMTAIRNWVAREPGSFQDLRQCNDIGSVPRQPDTVGFLRYDQGATVVAFHGDVLDGRLRLWGFDPEITKRELRDHGHLRAEGGRLQAMTAVPGEGRRRCTVLILEQAAPPPLSSCGSL